MKNLIKRNLPEFEVQAYHEGDFTTVKHEDLLGKWNVLFFYPADFTFVCPTELEDLQDHYEDLKKMGVEVYSVSTDTHFTHKQWHETSDAIGKVTYPMIADPTHVLTKHYGVHIKEDGMAYRGTFVLNPEGEVVVAEIHDNGIGRNAEELVRKIKAAKFISENPDEVCPAKWKEGEETLKPGLDLVGKI